MKPERHIRSQYNQKFSQKLKLYVRYDILTVVKTDSIVSFGCDFM